MNGAGRVLVVDDEDGIRAFLSEALGDGGFEVVTAPSGDQALTLLEKEGFEVVLTDMKMPGLSELALVERYRKTDPDMVVVVLTAHGTVETAVAAMKAGAFDYLQKPVRNLTELILTIRRAIEHGRLRKQREEGPSPPPLTWGAPAMKPVVEAIQKVAPSPASVLLLGESGAGKEIAARTLHAASPRARAPFVAVNCAALSESLLESELFGHERGAFTGAHARKRGKIELAAGGTFLLDEVGELQLPLQAKLLRVLQERSFERVGGHQTLRVDVRWVAATNQDLAVMIADGRFREDLYHRLAVFPIRLPPLRERPEDIVPLAQHLLDSLAADLGRSTVGLSPEAERHLLAQSWNGNIRALRNALERALILSGGDQVEVDDFWADPATQSSDTPSPALEIRTLEDAERSLIARTLETFDGNRKKTAESLGIGLRTLYDKLKRYGLG
ncbi:MAG: sigma-54 dependent transcriptional regulator [Myxococcota bacterium]